MDTPLGRSRHRFPSGLGKIHPFEQRLHSEIAEEPHPLREPVRSHDILYRVSRDILYTPARVTNAGVYSDALENDGAQRAACAVRGGGFTEGEALPRLVS